MRSWSSTRARTFERFWSPPDMPKLHGVSHAEALRVFRKLGYRIVREGKHTILSDGNRMLVIPRHNPIHSITMGCIARDAGLSPEAFKKLL